MNATTSTTANGHQHNANQQVQMMNMPMPRPSSTALTRPTTTARMKYNLMNFIIYSEPPGVQAGEQLMLGAHFEHTTSAFFCTVYAR